VDRAAGDECVEHPAVQGRPRRRGPQEASVDVRRRRLEPIPGDAADIPPPPRPPSFLACPCVSRI
jgi:hypothetical protein